MTAVANNTRWAVATCQPVYPAVWVVASPPEAPVQLATAQQLATTAGCLAETRAACSVAAPEVTPDMTGLVTYDSHILFCLLLLVK